MKKHTKNKGKRELPGADAFKLMGHQSVRTTFKLTENAIQIISAASVHLGVKQKSLFEHLIGEIKSFESFAHEFQSHKFEKEPRFQKTYVLSKKSLLSLKKASENFHTPRDVLVEYSIRRLKPVIENERIKHRQRKKILKDLALYKDQGEKLLKKSEKLLGEDDPVHDKIEKMITNCVAIHKNIETFIEKCEIIENFELD